MTSFILPFLVSSVNVALPTMGREFNMEAVVMSWVSTIYFLAVAVSQVPFGRLSDIYGLRRIFIIGLAITTFASFLSGVANSVPLLVVSRALQGFGAGMTFNNSIAILSSVFPAKERGRALGISMAGYLCRYFPGAASRRAAHREPGLARASSIPPVSWVSC